MVHAPLIDIKTFNYIQFDPHQTKISASEFNVIFIVVFGFRLIHLDTQLTIKILIFFNLALNFTNFYP
jgi:membrane-anchored protein YejM (alkaline phosphatase superfamily)